MTLQDLKIILDGLETVGLQHGDVPRCQQVFDDGYCLADILGGGFALRLICWEGITAEGGTMRVESHAQMGRLLLFEYLLECVHKSDDGRCVQSL